MEKLENFDETIYNAQVYDFSTLYTNLNLNDVKKAMKGMLDLIFNRDGNKFINISLFKRKTFFSNKTFNGFYTFSKDSLLLAVNYILDNTYVVFGNFLLKQDCGIPMGGNSSGEIAKSSLGFYEFDYMKELMKNKKQWDLAKRLSNNSRYIDDLITINYLHFDKVYPSIYPESLLMQRAGNDNKNINYLDLNIIIGNEGKITTKVFCKQDDFDFPVVQYSFPDGNMPHDIGHNIFYGQILRFALLCSKKEDFVNSAKKLFQSLIDRGYHKRPLLKQLNKALKNNSYIVNNYEIMDNIDFEKQFLP